MTETLNIIASVLFSEKKELKMKRKTNGANYPVSKHSGRIVKHGF